MRVRFLPRLTSRGNRLESGTGRGSQVHAGSFLRKREMVLERELLAKPRELERIFVHEVFHFVWLRAGNRQRAGYEALVAAEMERGARGELGWSSEIRKEQLAEGDRKKRTLLWREYVCESFCDTAAWHVCGQRGHGEVRLAERFRRRRAAWFEEYLLAGRLAF